MAASMGDDGVEILGVPRPECAAGVGELMFFVGTDVALTLSMSEAEALLSELAREMVEARRLATIPRPWLKRVQ